MASERERKNKFMPSNNIHVRRASYTYIFRYIQFEVTLNCENQSADDDDSLSNKLNRQM